MFLFIKVINIDFFVFFFSNCFGYGNKIMDFFFDGLRYDIMFFIISYLDFLMVGSFINGTLYRLSYCVCIYDDLVYVMCY